MMSIVKLCQSDIQLANCRKLESSISNALSMIPVRHGKLHPKLENLDKCSAKPARSMARPVCHVPPTHECVPEPVQEFGTRTFVTDGRQFTNPAGGSMNHTILLALDLGTMTGWALRNQHGRIVSGTAHFRPRRFEGGGMRYLRFERWLNETRNVAGGLDAVYFEEVRRHAGVDAAHAYGGFLAQLTAWCEHHGIPYEGVPVGTIKHFITGKGNAKKEQVIAAVKTLGHNPEDDNEADALALLHWAINLTRENGQ